MISRAYVAAVAVMLCMSVRICVGQEAKEAEQASLNPLIDKSILSLRIVPKGDEQLPLRSLPVLRWTNDVRDSHSVGLLSLWVDRGRPVAVLGSYVWQGRLIHEFDSISRIRFQAFEKDSLIWEPNEQVEFTTVANKIVVEKSPTGRIRQMKSFASKISVTMLGWRRDLSDREQLRLLPRELYRYPADGHDYLDGAIFAFVLGTDPEALLVLEAIDRNGQSEWQYAFVRQTSAGLDAVRDGVSIWQVNPHPPRSAPNGLGFTFDSKSSIPAMVDGIK